MANGHLGLLDYHRRMIGDVARMEAFERALRVLVSPGDRVLDLGCGTGVLAMLAARRGARVHAVECAPVAGLARHLIACNGLDASITVHHADIRGMAPVAPVDLVVSDFMGRMVFDDLMSGAVRAAESWMAPGARFCPREVRLMLGLVSDLPIEMIDVFTTDTLGLDLAPCASVALHTCYPALLPAGALAGEPVHLATLRPPAVPDAMEAHAELVLARPGVLRALAGWFDADLAPGVTLTTAPGHPTHWGQMLFPVPATVVEVGTRVSVELRFDGSVWWWTGRVADAPFACSSRLWEAVAALPTPEVPEVLPRSARIDLNRRGAEAFSAGDLATALGCFRRAARGLGHADDDLARPLYENLGLTLYNLGHLGAAATCFLRALDGEERSYPQSAEFLARCLPRGR